MLVTAVDIALCRLEMPHPVRLGAVAYTTRDYVTVRLRTDEGLSGYAYGYERGTPLADALRSVGQHVVGTSPAHRRRTIDRLLSANAPARSAMIRAISLLEIALWDLTAKAAGMPLHHLLGATRDRVPAMPVCGYFLDVVGEDGLHEQIADLVGRGFRQLKLIGGARSPRETERFVGACREAAGEEVRLAVDVHYSLRTREDAVRVARALDACDVSFLEDPFPPSRWRDMVAVAGRVRTPLAAGEDVADPVAFGDLLEAVSVLRPDATTCGGIAAALTGIELAATAGASVIPHVFPGLSGQLAGAYPHISCVEVILPEVGADPIDAVLSRSPEIVDGELVIDTTPGHGIELDWDAVERIASAASTLD